MDISDKNNESINQNDHEASKVIQCFDVSDAAADLVNSIPNKLELTVNIGSGVQSAIERYAEIFETSEILAKRLTLATEAVREFVSNFDRILRQIDINELARKLTESQEIIKNFVSSLQVPSISETRKQQLVDSHRQWGLYGWTLDPNGQFDELFINPPVDKKDADKKALKCLNKPEILFQEISSQKRVKQKDFTEAVEDFNEKRYKSCALLLFSLIDAQLIRFQRKAETQGRRRGVGLTAVSKAKERIGVDSHNDWFYLAMFFANLFGCLEKHFEKGNDFKNQPDIINRNFLNHGMLTKPITRKDCLQLFLLYSNMLEMLDMAYSSKKKD